MFKTFLKILHKPLRMLHHWNLFMVCPMTINCINHGHILPWASLHNLFVFEHEQNLTCYYLLCKCCYIGIQSISLAGGNDNNHKKAKTSFWRTKSRVLWHSITTDTKSNKDSVPPHMLKGWLKYYLHKESRNNS